MLSLNNNPYNLREGEVSSGVRIISFFLFTFSLILS